MSLYDWALATLFLVWIVATLFSQKRGKMSDFFRRGDLLQLVPYWTFFAPRPGTEDFALVFRTVTEAGEVSPWREFSAASPRRWLDAVWNPTKTEKKVLLDLSHEILAESGEIAKTDQDPRLLQLSSAYISLLHVTTQIAASDGAAKRVQFAVIMTGRGPVFREPKVVLLSDAHAIEA